jgi:hypothetical protein
VHEPETAIFLSNTAQARQDAPWRSCSPTYPHLWARGLGATSSTRLDFYKINNRSAILQQDFLNFFTQFSGVTMDSFSIWHGLIVMTAVLVVLLAGSLMANKNGALVVKKFFVSPSPRDDGVYVEIIGRQSGLIAWLFALLKIDPTLEMRVRHDKVEYMAASFSGFERVILPIHSVSSVFFGVVRPWLKALSWLLIFLVGAYAAAEAGSTGAVIGLTLAGVVVAVLIFVLGRERSIGFTEMTGDDYALRLKRSVIEGQEISEERLAEIAAIIVALLDAHKKAD